MFGIVLSRWIGITNVLIEGKLAYKMQEDQPVECVVIEATKLDRFVKINFMPNMALLAGCFLFLSN